MNRSISSRPRIRSFVTLALGAALACLLTTAAHATTMFTGYVAPAAGYYNAGDTIDIGVKYTGTAFITGTPRIRLQAGAQIVYASYLSGSGTTQLTFRYHVNTGTNAPGLTVLGFDLNGGTLRDAASVDIDPFLLDDGFGTVIDTIAPTTIAVRRHLPFETGTAASTVLFRVTFSEPMTGADPNAFQLTATSTVTGTIAWVRGEGAEWYVAVTNITGLGTLGLVVRPAMMTDRAGNGVASSAGSELYCRHTSASPLGWGAGSYGQIGDNANLNRNAPVPLYAAAGSPLYTKTVAQLATGGTHSLALATDGLLFAWGEGTSGRLGTGNNSSFNYPEAVKMDGGLAGQKVIATAAGGTHSLALVLGGLVFTWGDNTQGQLGRGNNVSINQPVYVADTGTPMQGKTIVALAAGYQHSLALSADGLVFAWGDNTHGQLGNNSTTPSNVPVAVSTAGALLHKKVVAIAAGYWFSAALTADGQIVTWGLNNFGQLGNGDNLSSSIPVAVAGGAQAGRTAVELAAGGAHLLARNTDGSLTAWGSNNYGQLGNNSTTSSSLPLVVTMSGALSGVSIARLDAADAHSLALTADGRLASWGFNTSGQLGNGANTAVHVPTLVPATGPLDQAIVFSLGQGSNADHALALTRPRARAFVLTPPSAGTYATGSTFYFTLLFTDTIQASGSLSLDLSFAGRTVHLTSWSKYDNSSLMFGYTVQPGDFAPGGPTFLGISLNGGAIRDRFGYDVALDRITAGPFTTVVIDARQPVPLALSRALPYAFTEAAAVTTANALIYRLEFDKPVTGVDPADFTLATTGTAAGTVANVLGTGDSRFVVVTGVTGSGALRLDLKSTGTGIADTIGNPLAGGLATGQCYVHLGATALFGWGSNNLGQVGINNGGYGDTIPSPSTVPTTGALYGKTVAALATGFAHSLALCTDGTLAAWGDNNFGQLGCAYPDSSSATPVAVALNGALSGKTVIAIAAGATHCLALTSDGFLYAWGRNDQGQLGTGSGSDDRNLPTAVYATGALAGESVIALAAGTSHSLALTASGRLFAWGSDSNDQLGNGSFGASLTPTPVDLTVAFPGERIVSIAAGSLHSLALGSGGHVYAWGSNSSGQVGDDGFIDVESPVLIDVSSALPGYNAIVVAIAAGEAHSAVLTSDGGLFTWGANDRRQLGDGSSVSLSRIPVAVDLFAFGGDAPVALAAGNRHNLARTATGLLFGWGNNYSYPLTGSVGSISPTPALLESGILGTADIAALASGGRADHSLVLANTAGDPLAAIEHWRLQFFDTPFGAGVASDTADPDSDGRPNLLEYATGTNPINADSGPAGALAITGTGANRRLTLTFNRIEDPSLTYTVEASATLVTGSWTPIVPPAMPLIGPVTVTDPEFMSGHARRFLRLRIERTP